MKSILASTLSLALVGVALADPSNKSGKMQIALSCSAQTLPDGGRKPGGEGRFDSMLAFFPDGQDGQKIQPSCTTKSSTCDDCVVSGHGLTSDIHVQSCWNPPAGRSGCGIEFDYNGYHYNSQNKEPYCGHTNKFGAFSDTITALCYFNATGKPS